ncbi:hypothetical protein D5S17_35135 [Pseudonocardiaceae bacterium YIM PH 21723]|nr:hypothetical protein D5S17_35135 [Pseudonocardiaceae bacterium YIM PH 21723]
MFSKFRTVMIGAAAAALLLSLTPSATAAGQAPVRFADQAQSIGLSGAEARDLQSQIDGLIARQGGTQVAVNRVDMGGYAHVITIPGERYPRVAGDFGRTAPLAAACAYKHMCAYKWTGFVGDGDDFIDMYKCEDRWIPWTTMGSWINNQTKGTRAQFKDRSRIVRFTSDPAYSSDASAPWDWVGWVKPC